MKAAYPRKIVFDPKLRRPGCVLLQAAAGLDYSVAHLFPSETWLVSPTNDMAVYVIESHEQLERLVRMATAATAVPL